ncbi:hypothetical protein [Galenea microaerophila]
MKSLMKNIFQKQKGSISLLGASALLSGMFVMAAGLELGGKRIKDAQYDMYAQAIAPIALRSEIALTKAMVENGQADQPFTLSQTFLSEAGVNLENTVLTLTYGNIHHLDTPKTVTDDQGNQHTINEEFIPLEQHADNPKKGLGPNEVLPKFNAVAVEIQSKPSGIFRNFIPKGRSIYGLSDDQENSPEMGSCFCDARFNACMAAEKTNNVMGEKESNDRRTYCETGMAPAVGSFFSFFFGGKPKFPYVDSVKLSPQWVGRPYQAEMGGSATDETSGAWQQVQNHELLTVVNGSNPFPEASWDAENAQWLPGNYEMKFTGWQNVKVFLGIHLKYKNPWEVDGEFYVGRSGVCAYPSKGFFFFQMLNLAQEFLWGNTDCLRYTANPDVKYDWAKPLLPFFNLINSVTGANQHYYSCRDFSGISSARNGFFQVMRRIWSNPILDWTKSYQQADCSVKTMHFHGFWIFGRWRAE